MSLFVNLLVHNEKSKLYFTTSAFSLSSISLLEKTQNRLCCLLLPITDNAFYKSLTFIVKTHPMRAS